MIILAPKERPYDYFNVDDRIVVYVTFDKDDSEHYGKGLEGWYTGLVRPGYRHHDGCLSYVLDGIGPQDPPRDENGNSLVQSFGGYWGCGCAQPGIMKFEEFDYFKDHTDEYIEWFENSKKDHYTTYDYEFHPINESDIARFAKHLLLT